MKKVKCIFVDSSTKKITETKFDGKYYSIHELMGNDVSHINWVELFTGDFIYYEMESESENYVTIGNMKFRGNVVVVGEPTEDSTDYDWKCKNVSIPAGLVEHHTTFQNIKEVELVES